MKEKKKKKQEKRKAEEKLEKLKKIKKAESDPEQKKKKKSKAEAEKLKKEKTGRIETAGQEDAKADARLQNVDLKQDSDLLKEQLKQESGLSDAKLSKPQDVQMDAEAAAAVFRAIGDDIRLQIINLLTEQEQCAADLLKSVSVVQSTLSHHMKILCDAGVVSCRKQGKWSYYSINADVVKQAAEYLKMLRKSSR